MGGAAGVGVAPRQPLVLGGREGEQEGREDIAPQAAPVEEVVEERPVPPQQIETVWLEKVGEEWPELGQGEEEVAEDDIFSYIPHRG